MTPRTILYTGKGGVGKTSVATATALACARSGLRTIVMSTDPAHSLADSLDVPLGAKPREVEPNLFAQQVQANEEMERHWSAVQSWLTDLLSDRGLERITAEELTVPPGFDELFALLQIKDHHDSRRVRRDHRRLRADRRDAAPAELPRRRQVVDRQGLPVGARLISAARPVAKAFLDIPLPDKEVYNEVERLVGSLVAMNDILRDHEHTSLRLVMTPDSMVISEAMRTFTYLNLYGYLTDAVVVNRLFPEETRRAATSPAGARRSRKTSSACATRSRPCRCDRAVLRRGSDRRDDAHAGSATSSSTTAPRHRRSCLTQSSRKLSSTDDSAYLLLSLPFVEKGDIGLNKIGLEVVVRVGDQKRTIMLPNSMTGFKPQRRAVEDGRLRIEFERAERAAEAIS